MMFSKMRLVNNTNLKSEKNLCFVNTALQLLNSVPRMNTFFKMKEYRLPNEQTKQMKICEEVTSLFNTVRNFTSSAAELRRLVASKSGRHYLKDGSQQDTIEFLVTLLQEVENEISLANWEARTVIQEFWGIEEIEKKFLNNFDGICSKCKSSPRDEVEKIQVLPLNIPDTSRVITLNGIIENYFSESSDNAKMKCNCCTHKTNCPGTGVCKPKGFVSKKVLLKSPDILIVQINRYLNLTGNKIKTPVWPDDTLKLPNGDKFTLYGIGHHLGDHFSSGHYMASIKTDDKWIRCNDTQISNSSENESKSLECNICIYLKVFDSTTPFCPTDDWQDLKGRKAPGGLHYSFGLKGNYARNMNLGEGIKFKKHMSPKQNSSPQESQNPVHPKKDNEKSEQPNNSDFVEDEGWITPKKTRRLPQKYKDHLTNPKIDNKIEITAKDNEQEQCNACGKKNYIAVLTSKQIKSLSKKL